MPNSAGFKRVISGVIAGLTATILRLDGLSFRAGPF
jgi:hypothetical protein